MIAHNNQIRPDGDIEIDAHLISNFRYPSCPRCDQIVKPDIIFFGDNVPKERVFSVYELIDKSDALLVIGSSLQVFSGYRFALRARELNKPIAVINIGPTRIDTFDNIVRLKARAGDVLTRVVL